MRRRGWIAIAIVFVTILAGAAGWYTWRRYTAPAPPVIAREGLDPELAEAIEAARRKIRADPYSAPAWGDLGKLLRAARLHPEAVACFAQAEQLEPNNPRWPYLQGEALHLSDNRAALPPLQRAAALAGSSDTIAPPLRLAEVLLALGRNDEAETQLRRALELEPDNPTVHYYLGLLALTRDDLPASLRHLTRCQHSPFTQRKACSQLAAVYRRMGRMQEADNYSRKADSLPQDRNWLDPFLSDVLAVGRQARFQQVHHLELSGNYRAAAEQLAALIKQRPEYRAYVALGEDLGKLGDLDGAELALRSAIELAPEKFEAYHELSRLLWIQADRIVRSKPERARAQFEEAAACARQALARRPDHAMSHVLLGMSLRRLGKRPEALEAFRRAVECAPNLVEAHLYLGETLAEAGQVNAARVALERARELKPDDPRPRAALAKLNQKGQKLVK
jgi:tetratricopeptide (TPR) repeat protein